MNISHDEYGPVDVDALMAVYNEKMQKRIDVISQHENEYDDEPAITKCSNPASDVDSQQCVGDVIITPNDTISAQKRTKANMSGLVHRRSYADVAAAPA